MNEAPLYYKEIELGPSTEDPRRLVFIAAANAPKVPEELLLLRQEYENTARVIAVLFDNKLDKRKELFLLLHETVYILRGGPNWNLEDGKANLSEIQKTVLDYSHKIRDEILKKYALLMLVFGVLPLLIGAVVLLTGAFGWFNRPLNGQVYDPLFAWAVAVFWIPAGAAVCVWGEFALRMQSGLTYDQLLRLDPSRWQPGQRLLITIGIAFIFSFLLAYNAIQVGLGGLLLNEFSTKTPAMALAVGGVTGLAFSSIQDILYRIKPAVK